MIALALGMGTSDQVGIGSNDAKRSTTLHSKGNLEKVVNIAENWKSKSPVKDSRFHSFSSHQRIFEPASNVNREKEDGCMNKIKIERSHKLRQEDFKGRKRFDIVSGAEQKDDVWIKSFGGQTAGGSKTRTIDVGRRATNLITHEDQKAHWAGVMEQRKSTI